MKNVKLFEEFLNEEHRSLTKEQEDFLNNSVGGTWKINYQGLIDVKGDVRIDPNMEIEEFPVMFGKVSGLFSLSENVFVKTLKGSPEEVGEHFSCSKCTSLVSLEGAPRKVGRDFFCSGCHSLRTLEGAPEKVGEDFYCRDCSSLKSLAYGPKETEEFYYSGCSSLPEEELEMYINNRELFFLWMKSEFSFADFKREKRGTIAAKNFGF